MKMLARNPKKEELINVLDMDQYFYITDKNWKFSLDDDKERQFGIVFEILNMSDATGEPEYEDYPYLVSAYIVPDEIDDSFWEGEEEPSSKESLLYDAISYCGGVPVDHVLTLSVRSGEEKEADAFANLVKAFPTAKVVKHKADFGTYAAQFGRDSEMKYLQFPDFDTAYAFVEYLVKYRLGAISMMIGFILDRPINLMGEDGWRTMKLLALGKEHKNPWEKSSKVQSILFPKNEWNRKDAAAWLRSHNYEISTPDMSGEYYRFRQLSPEGFVSGHMRTIVLGEHEGKEIKAIVGEPKK